MIKWLERWWWGGYEHSPKEQMAFVAGYKFGKHDGMRNVIDLINVHPLISARITDDGKFEVVHHAEKHFKDEFNWETSPRTNVLERHVGTYH